MYRLLFCVYVCVKAAVRQLKYITKYFVDKQKRVTKKRVMGIEPTYPAWKAGVLPLNYTRMGIFNLLYNAQFRNRTRDTRIFSPLLYQLS